MKPYLITLLCFFTFCSYAQITIQTEYSNGLPNSNCIAEIDAEIIAVSNRNGKLVLENKYRNQEVLIKDLVTEIQWKFTVNQDTTIITQDIQLLDEVEIKPIDKVKLSKELFKVNQDRLPEKLHISGELYYAELYIIHHKDTTRLSDTTHFMFNTIGTEYKQSYDKSDSTYLFLSKFGKLGEPGKNKLSFPFTHVEYSNPNKNYKEAYLTEELEMVFNLDLQGARVNFKNSYFTYFNIDSVYTSKQEFNAYEKTESLEKIIQETDVNSEEVKIRPKKIPLRFPEGILFR